MTRENIKRMQQVADANGCTLRPHIKTHKTPYFAKLQQQLGARGITSCKVSESEVMADAGLRDIFIAYPLVGAEKLRRACALAQRVIPADPGCGQHCAGHAAGRGGQGARRGAGGTHRGRLRRRAHGRGNGGLCAAGAVRGVMPEFKADGAFYTFRGLNGGIDDPALAGAREGELLAQYRKTAEEICGRKLEISGGSSPTGKYVAQSGQADEIRPGTYVFSDYMMYKECGAPLENVSARLVVTVVSVHKDYVVVDGGCKTFATDPQLDQPPYFFEGYARFPQYPELRIRRLTEEHGMVTAEGPMPELKVGDMLEAIPVHICPTVNLQNQIYVADGGVLRTEIVAGRGKLQ